MFKKMKLGTKLGFGFSIVILIAVVLGILGYYATSKLAGSLSAVDSVRLPGERALTALDARIPTSKPLIIIPMLAPRFSSELKLAASGKISCGTMEQMPIKTEAISNSKNVFEIAATKSAMIAKPVITKICFLRSNISPNGTKRNRPNA